MHNFKAAYIAGYRAATRGESKASNPYGLNTPHHHYWIEGYEIATQEKEEDEIE